MTGGNVYQTPRSLSNMEASPSNGVRISDDDESWLLQKCNFNTKLFWHSSGTLLSSGHQCLK